MDLDLSTYVFHYDKKKKPILNLSISRLWLRNHITIRECATDRPTNGPTDQPTKWLIESRSTQLKTHKDYVRFAQNFKWITIMIHSISDSNFIKICLNKIALYLKYIHYIHLFNQF